MSSAPERRDRSIYDAVLAAIVLIGLVQRLWDLGSVPGVHGDEGWYGLQLLRWMEGGEHALRTPTGNLLDPFHFAPLWAAVKLCGPTLFALRVPSMLTGLAALPMMFLLARTAGGPSAARIALALSAALPALVVYTRLSWDPSHVPLFAAIVVYYAWRERPFPLVLAMVAAFIVHPTAIFLGPLAAVLLTTSERRADWPWVRRHKRQLFALAVIGLALVFGAYLAGVGRNFASHVNLDRPLRMLTTPAKQVDFLVHLGRLFTGTNAYAYLVDPRLDVGFELADLFFALSIAGLVLVAIRRRGDSDGRLTSLLVGLALSIAAFFLVAGNRALHPGIERYATWLIAPALLAAALLLAQVGEARRIGLVLGLGLAALGLVRTQRAYFEPLYTTGGESDRSFRTASIEPKLQIIELLERASAGRTGVRVMVEEPFVYPTLHYLLGDGGRFRVERMKAHHGDELAELAAEGAFFVADYHELLERLLVEQLGSKLRVARVVDRSGRPIYSVFGPP